MQIGVPKEVKDHENRVGATPEMVASLVKAGHSVFVQSKAGFAIGYSDALYKEMGAEIVASAAEVYRAEMIIKVKEPQPQEIDFLYEGQVLFCYLHLAPEPELTRALLDKRVIGIAYETVTDHRGRLPLLIPMSEMAGRLATQAGAASLQHKNGGKGVLLGGVPGVPPARVVVVGGGVVGTQAARMALGLGADVTVLDTNLTRIRELDDLFGPRLKTLYSSPSLLEEAVESADLVVGSVLIPGKRAPKLITRKMIASMEHGSVFVDVAIDQGGCAETSRPTTHSQPTYVEEGVVHYCVTNIPGACARTSTQALTNATYPYALKLANKGYWEALMDDEGLREGLNVCFGQVTNKEIAADLGYELCTLEDVVERA